MHRPNREMKDQIAYLALFYAINGQNRQSERLRRIIRKLERPLPALAS